MFCLKRKIRRQQGKNRINRRKQSSNQTQRQDSRIKQIKYNRNMIQQLETENPMRKIKIERVVLSCAAVGTDLDKSFKLLEILSKE